MQEDSEISSKESAHTKSMSKEGRTDVARQNKIMLVCSFVLAFLFFIPLSALAGLILGIVVMMRSDKKVAPIVAIVLNLVMGFLNVIFTLAFAQVFFG